ncbi:UNVERIFIED_CONTAM: hypothetical protein GTU68_032652 [Idotea baltica]|nr:hypothetical protein [Idotea baltica]
MDLVKQIVVCVIKFFKKDKV